MVRRGGGFGIDRWRPAARPVASVQERHREPLLIPLVPSRAALGQAARPVPIADARARLERAVL